MANSTFAHKVSEEVTKCAQLSGDARLLNKECLSKSLHNSTEHRIEIKQQLKVIKLQKVHVNKEANTS
jgi:hypothetical protein